MKNLSSYLVLVICALSFFNAHAQITGVVYKDFNGNGSRQTSAPNNEPGVAGIIVNAYNNANSLVESVVSGGDGTYTISSAGPLRIEFVIPAAANCVNSVIDYTGFSGDGNNIRFVTSFSSVQNYAVLNPDQYASNTNPKVYVPMYVMGNPLGSGTASTQTAMWGYDFNSANTTAGTLTVSQNLLGTVWGTTYSKQAKKIFASAFIKRHCGLGPLGSGGIYMLAENGSTFTVSNFYDLDANGIRTRAASSAVPYGSGSSFSISSGMSVTYLGATDPVSGSPEGLGVIGNNATERLLPDNMDADTYDPAAFDQVGKVGLGDIDISDDGKYLFVTNLYSRQLVRLELNDAYNPTSVVNISTFTLPAIAVSNGVLRPFAVQYHRGKVYVGAVTTGENGGSNTINGSTDLYAHVFELNDPNGSGANFTTTPILSQALNYQKGYAIFGLTFPGREWHPWTNSTNDTYGGMEFTWGSPILSNIEFTDRGDMILDFMDRGGHQFGYNTFKHLNNSATPTNAMYDVTGDILIAGKNCNTGGWVIESNGSYNSNGIVYTSGGVGTSQGPGGGEFYYQDIPPDNYHNETSQGAVAVVPGTEHGIFTLMDANSAFSGGTAHFSHYTGDASNRLNLYGNTDGTLSKANGLGDIEVAGEEPGIEIGNRVWLDNNYNGIQDASEPGIANVSIELFCDNDQNGIPDGSAIASTITDITGYWYFNQLNVADGDCSLGGAQVGIQPGKHYLVRIGDADWNSGAGKGKADLLNLSLTAANATVTGIADATDNDAVLQTNIPQIEVLAGKLGQNNHTYDFGFSDCNADAGNAVEVTCTNPSHIIGTPAISGQSYSWLPSTGLNNASIAQPTAQPTVTTTYTLTVNGSCTDTVTVVVNKTSPVADAGPNKNLDCATTSTTIGTAAIAGNSYSWNPSSGLNNSGIAQPTATPTTTTIYTVTVTGSNGCTASSVVTVTVNQSAPTADAGPNKDIDCNTTHVQIGSSSIIGNSYSWTPATGLQDPNIAQPDAQPSATTIYTVTVSGSNSCTATSTVTVSVNTTPPFADAGPNKNLDCANTQSTIGTPAIAGHTYSWLPNSQITNANTAEPTVNPTTTTIYTVTVTGTNGCTATDIVTVNVNSNTGSVGNYVWIDANANGLQDEGPTAGVNGVSVELWDAVSNTLSATTTTANDNLGNPGYYQFSICNPSNYQIKFPLSVQGGTQVTLQNPSTITDNNSDASKISGLSSVFSIDPNTLGLGKDNLTIDAGYYNLACLGNYIWNDLNQNGMQDNGEVGVAGISITLYDAANTIIASTLTDAYGYYQFCNLMPNTYHIGVTLPQNYIFTNSNNGNDAVDSDVDPLSGLSGNYVIASGDSNMTIDAGIYYVTPTTASIGNYVWYDINQDGLQDSNEQGISGVTVTLYNSLGNIVGTTVTDANGFYLFSDVLPGNYWVGFTQPPGLIFTTQLNAVNNPSNSDANTSNGLTGVFQVNAGDHITYVDAGLYSQSALLGGLGDKVWYDVNQNGIQDLEETGVAGVQVTLYNSDGTTSIAQTTTDAFGNYIFNGLAQGSYMLGFTNLPVGYVLTTKSIGDSTYNSDANAISAKTDLINLGAGQFNLTYDAGIYTTIPGNTNSIGNFVWHDINKNGLQDNLEPGIAGVTVTLYNSTNTVLATTATNSNGYYLFPDLPNGDYYVGFSNIPPSYVLTSANAGSDDSQDSDADMISGLTAIVSLTGNTHNMSVDAGMYLGNTKLGKASLGDLVWFDLNNNGIQDAGETGVQGITVNLLAADATTILSTTITNALGNYIFTGLDAGTYYVSFGNIPSGYTISTQNADNQGLNGEFNSDVHTTTAITDIIVLGSSEDKMSVDMGIVPPSGTASLGNLVWFDLNQNGLQDITEPGVQGVSVYLYNNAGSVVANTTTNEEGIYYFVGLTPGTYSVGFDNLPVGYALTTENIDASGVNGSINSDANITSGLTPSVTLVAGDQNYNLDAGIVSTTVASVGDYVWFDANHDGIQDPTESGMGGILVTLYNNAGTPVASAITDEKGAYIFTNVIPGDYTIGFSNIPVGMEFTNQESNPTSNTGSNADPLTGRTPIFIVVAGTHNPTIDAGLAYPLLCGLGNYVWHDVNENGLQEASEPPVAGVLITLYAADGTTKLANAVTDGNGAYSFTSLNPGTYVVGFSHLPAGSTRTKTVGSLQDALNSDMNVDGKTTPVTLLAGEYNPNLDAGIYFGIPLTAKSLVATAAFMNDRKTATINWYTLDEENTHHFDIERSVDLQIFEKVASVNASIHTQGKQTYSTQDDLSKVIDAKTIYYRIKLIDADGKAIYSNIVFVKTKVIENDMVVYPMPFTDEIKIEYHAAENSEVELKLVDMTGRVILHQVNAVNKGLNTLSVTQLSNLASGTYHIKLFDVNLNANFVQTIIK